MTDEPVEYAELVVRWTNVEPPLDYHFVTPCVVVDEEPDEPGAAPQVTIWDWNGVPDALSVGLVVNALELLGIDQDQIPADASWYDLVAMLGPGADGVIEAEVLDME